MNWKSRQMPLAEWSAFQNMFEELFVASAAPSDWALFIRSEPGRDVSTVLLTPGAGAVLGRDWNDHLDPNKSGWALLVGHADAFERFGVSRP